jgi:hypothetical protein
MTDDPAAAPEILRVGCEAILLEPFAPNLLFARIGRLLREFSLSTDELTRRGGSRRLVRVKGTNVVFPEMACPQCQTRGATSFDFHSYRRAWYACTSCCQVWVGPRIE